MLKFKKNKNEQKEKQRITKKQYIGNEMKYFMIVLDSLKTSM